MDNPLVSIIIPCFNCKLFLKESLDSVFSQDYDNCEVIVVDDGSKDESCLIVENYPKPVRLIRQKNKGPASARNLGVRESNGKLIAFLDGDDVWLPNKLKAQVDLLMEFPDVDVVFGAFKRWDVNSDNKYPSKIDYIVEASNNAISTEYSGWIYHKLLLNNSIHIITAVIRRSLFEKLEGFDETLQTGEDYDFWLRASRLTKVCKIARVLSLYRVNPESTTHIPREEHNEKIVLLRAIEKYGLKSPDGQTVSKKEMSQRMYKLNFGHGYLHFKHNSPCIAKSYFKKSLKYSQKKFKVMVYIGISYLLCLLK